MVFDVAGGEGLLLAVGAEFLSNRGRPPPATWISSDVEDGWERIEVPNEVLQWGPVVADGTGFVVFGGMKNENGEALWRWEPSSGWDGPDQLPDAGGFFYVGNELHWRPGQYPGSEIGEWIGTYSNFLRVEDGFIITGITHGAESRAVVATSRDGVAWQSAPLRPDAAPPGSYAEPAVYQMVEFGGRVIAVGDAVYVGPAKVSDYSP